MTTARTSMAFSLGAALAIMVGCGAANQHRKIEDQGKSLRFELAQTYVEKRAHQAAIPLLKRVLAESPRNVDARVLYASVLRDLGLYPQAQAQFELALKLAKRTASAHAGLGILLDLQGRRAEALRHHRASVRLAPRDASYRNNLGFSLYLANQTDSAIKQLETALELDPALTVAYNNVGFAYGRRGDFDKAERSFRVTSTHAAALFNMSLVYDDHGATERANQLREHAYELEPSRRPTESEDKP